MKSPDLGKFKKVSSNDKFSTFKHEDGHELKIAHSALSGPLKKQLADIPHYASGGAENADFAGLTDEDYNSANRDPASSPEERSASASRLHMKKSEMDAIDSAPPAPVDQSSGFYSDKSNQSQMSEPVPPSKYPGARSQISQLSSDEPVGNQSVLANGNPPSKYPGAVSQINQLQGNSPANAQQTAPQANISPGNPNIPPGMGEQNNGLPPPGAPGVENPYTAGPLAEMQNLQEGQSGYANALKNEAALVSGQGAMGIGASEDLQKNYAIAQKSWQDAHNEILGRRQDLMKYIAANPINPDHYMEGKNNLGLQRNSVLGKVSTAIGLILGGAGAHSTGGQNMFVNYMNNQIDRDVAAQKANLGLHENLLAANFRESGDLDEAMKMTKINLADIYSQEMQRQAQIFKGPMALQQAQQGISALQMGKANEVGSLTQKIAMGNMVQHMQGSGQPLESQLQALKMSGFISGSDASKATSELGQYRVNEATKNNILTMANKVYKDQSLDNRIMNPIQSSQSIKDLNSAIHLEAAKALGARATPQVLQQIDNMTAGIMTGKKTASQMQAVLNSIFDQKGAYPTLQGWGMLGKNQGYNKEGGSNFNESNVK